MKSFFAFVGFLTIVVSMAVVVYLILANVWGWMEWKKTLSGKQGYSAFSRFWQRVPHEHKLRHTLRGYGSVHGAIHDYQCLRCWRSMHEEHYEKDCHEPFDMV